MIEQNKKLRPNRNQIAIGGPNLALLLGEHIPEEEKKRDDTLTRILEQHGIADEEVKEPELPIIPQSLSDEGLLERRSDVRNQIRQNFN